MAILSRAAAAFNASNRRFPLFTQGFVAGGIAAAGDLMMQRYEGGARSLAEVDLPRMLRLAAFRALIFGPAYHTWMKALERTAPMGGGGGWIGLIKKVGLDQFVWAPPALGTFYVAMTLMEGKPLAAGLERCRTSLWHTLTINWVVWIPMQMITLGVVPVPYRVAFVSVLQCPWNALLSGWNESARQTAESSKDSEAAAAS